MRMRHGYRHVSALWKLHPVCRTPRCVGSESGRNLANPPSNLTQSIPPPRSMTLVKNWTRTLTSKVCSAQGSLSIDGVDSATPGSNDRGGVFPLRPDGSAWNQQLHASRTTALAPRDEDGVAGEGIGLQLLGLVLTIPIALQGPGRVREVSLNGQNEQVEESVPNLHPAEGKSEAQARRERGGWRTVPQQSTGSTPDTGGWGIEPEEELKGVSIPWQYSL
jgi:hypothetical protein